MLSFITITHIIREKSDQKEDGSYEKTTLTTLLGLLFVLPLSSCGAVPPESGSSFKGPNSKAGTVSCRIV